MAPAQNRCPPSGPAQVRITFRQLDRRTLARLPIEYEVFIDITSQDSIARSGLRGTAEIFVEKVSKAILAPVSSIVREGDAHFVVVAEGNKRELRQVTLGPNNESHVVVVDGLRVGELVLVVGDSFSDAGEKTPTPEN